MNVRVLVSSSSSRDEAIRKAREVYLIERGQTLEPKGITETVRNLICYTKYLVNHRLQLHLILLISTRLFTRWFCFNGNFLNCNLIIFCLGCLNCNVFSLIFIP